MVQFLPIDFFLGFLQFLLGFSKFPVFFCVTLYIRLRSNTNKRELLEKMFVSLLACKF